MTVVALIRHMPTAWNVAGRLQGTRDTPLDADPPDWRMPPELAGFRWLTSPLSRAAATARRLGVAAPAVDPRLGEMAWGEWEGQTLAELRSSLGADMAAAEARGLDFRPPGGESPREVQRRVLPLLQEIAAAGEPVAAVTHKGVIRAVLALATGWDMLGKPPARLSRSAAQLFRLDPAGHPSVERLNLALGCA